MAWQLVTPPQEATCTVVDIEVEFYIEVHDVRVKLDLRILNYHSLFVLNVFPYLDGNFDFY